MPREELKDKYFLGTITPTELNELNAELERDAAFKKEFEQDKAVQLAIKVQMREDIKNKFQPKRDMYEREIRIRRKNRFRNLSMAASFLLLIGIGWYITVLDTLSGMYDDYYQPYRNEEIVITRLSPDTPETRAFGAYEEGEYVEAVKNLGLLKSENTLYHVNLYLGISHLELGNTQEAIRYFQLVVEKNEKYQSEALWYLALGHLKNRDKASAVKVLEDLIAHGDYKEAEANEILDRLN